MNIPRLFEDKNASERHQRQYIVEERWLCCTDGKEEWFDECVEPSMRVHLVRLPHGRLIEQTHTYIVFPIEDTAGFSGRIVPPHGADWEYYGGNGHGDRSANSSIWRRKHNPKHWKYSAPTKRKVRRNMRKASRGLV